MDVQVQKQELQDWLSKVEDEALIEKLSKLMKDSKSAEEKEDYILDESKIRSLSQISQWWENLV